MLLAHEFAGYAHKRKGLRVSSAPAGKQRSKYFLQIPLRYGVPMVGVSAVLHWLASQSIFVVVVEVYNMFGNHSASGLCFHWPGRRYGSVTDDGASQPRYCGGGFWSLGWRCRTR
jgi:hypothetical protein